MSRVCARAAKTLSIFGRTSQIRTGDLYHVKVDRTRHNTEGHIKIQYRSGSDAPVLHCKTHVSSRYHLHHVTRQRNSSRYVAYVCLGASGPAEELNQAIREQVARLRTKQVLH